MTSRVDDVRTVTVFPDGPGGGNPAPIVLAAADLGDGEMQAVARHYGYESAFVVDPAGTGCDLALRFWVPNHEMSMCGHATLGTVWLLARLGRVPADGELKVHTRSGVVQARLTAGEVAIDQPSGDCEPVQDPELVDTLLEALGLTRDDLAGRPVRNARTSRTKTLVPLRDVATLDALDVDPQRVALACAALDSTGLYPYAPSGDRQFDARQFPASSGYLEDAATGIAAAALAVGLLADGDITAEQQPITVRQGRAMGRPSRITVTPEAGDGLGVVRWWISGPCVLSG